MVQYDILKIQPSFQTGIMFYQMNIIFLRISYRYPHTIMNMAMMFEGKGGFPSDGVDVATRKMWISPVI